MADSKITALTSIGTSTDPANDPLVIVDVSDTSMAASGTTKKVTLNNLLACSPTATLASATITGDLTVDTSTLFVNSTSNRVGIGTASPLAPFHVNGTDTTNALINGVSKGVRFVFNSSQSSITGVDNTGAASFQPLSIGGSALDFSLSGSTAMTLNSTGLGVGVASLTNSEKLNAAGTIVSTGASLSSFGVNQGGFDYNTSTRQLRVFSGTADATGSFISFVTGVSGTINEKMRIDSSGNVGIGVTPAQKLDVGSAGTTRIAVRDTSSTGVGLIKASGADVYLDNASATGSLILQNNNGTSRVVIDINGNIGFGASGFGTSAVKVIAIGNGTAPTTSPAGMGQLYVEAGALKYRGSSGTVTTIAAA